MSEKLARRFHDIYERLAPAFGYETREETRRFDPTSKNGRLMSAVTDVIEADVQAENARLQRDLEIMTQTAATQGDRAENAEAEAKRLGGHISDAIAQVETWRGRAKNAEAEVERLRRILLALVATGGEVVMEDDREGAAFSTVRPLANALAEAREVLAESAKGAKP